jgi:chemotaxis-related protein WspD
MIPLPTTPQDCWNHIGVNGDRSCPELARVVHCHNCEVFTGAGRRFLDAPAPAGYLEEWTARLAEPEEQVARELVGVLVFRLAGEWLALPVQALVEVIPLRTIHRIPFRGGLLAGLVNVRGELHLAVRLDQVLGIRRENGQEPTAAAAPPENEQEARRRLLVVRRNAEVWVFSVDEVDRVVRFPAAELVGVPPTLSRAATRFARGVYRYDGRVVGLLDDQQLFETLRTRVR